MLFFFPVDQIISGLHHPFQSDWNFIQIDWGVYSDFKQIFIYGIQLQQNVAKYTQNEYD